MSWPEEVSVTTQEANGGQQRECATKAAVREDLHRAQPGHFLLVSHRLAHPSDGLLVGLALEGAVLGTGRDCIIQIRLGLCLAIAEGSSLSVSSISSSAFNHYVLHENKFTIGEDNIR